MARINFSIMVLLINYIAGSSLNSRDGNSGYRTPSSPCLYDNDSAYGGVLVDCRRRQLLSFPPAEWIPSNTTTLLLQSNSILNLDKVFLGKATKLRFLSLADNTLSSINPLAFRFNKELQVLDLEYNQISLDNRSITKPLFVHLEHLVELRLKENRNSRMSDSVYPTTLLAGLRNLRNLTLDTFYGDLDFNGIFKETPNLTSLVLGGGIYAIRNESFREFDSIKLKQLTISNSADVMYTEKGAWRYLKHLDSFSVMNTRQSMETILESLAPFVHRNFTLLRFHNLNKRVESPAVFKRICELSPRVVQYLSQICVKQLSFTNNKVFFIDPHTISSPTWSRCLVSFDLSMNPLLGSMIELMHFFTAMRSLKLFTLSGRKYSFLNQRGENGSHKEKTLFNASGSTNIMKKRLRNNCKHCLSYAKNTETRNLKQIEKLKRQSYKTLTNSHQIKSITIHLPVNLVYLNLDGISMNFGKFNIDIMNVTGGDNLKELRLSDAGLSVFTGELFGLRNLIILDISLNDGTNISAHFINSFPSLIKLNVSMIYLDKKLISTKSEDIFQGLHYLQDLDMSGNNLYILPSGIFTKNKLLKHLNLARNRFTTLQFNIDHLPCLAILDIRANSFLQFSGKETAVLEKHAMKIRSFSVFLDGNVFSCSCSSVIFLRWLRDTFVHLDNNKNYSCVLEDGTITTTNSITDVEGLWRHCQGQVAFLTSLILACVMALGCSLATLGIKFKTQIAAVIFQLFSSNFILKTPRDYERGVYISYSDQDTDFAFFTLREFVEKRLKLTTYARDKDLIPSSDMAQSIVSAVHSSWRSLLVVSEHYLQDSWSYLAMKTAMYAVCPSNPDRLVMVIISHGKQHVEHKIPLYILQAVRQENVINISSVSDKSGRLTERQQEALRRALLE